MMPKKDKYFVGYIFNDKSREKLKRYLKSLKLDNPINVNRSHITIINTPLLVPEKEQGSIYKYNAKPERVMVRGKELKLYDYNDKKVLALDVDCKKCTDFQKEIYKKFMKNRKYENYNPHITLDYDYKKKNIPRGSISPKSILLQTKQIVVNKH